MKVFNSLMSGKSDHLSSSFNSNVSEDDDKPDLQQILIKESHQRHLPCIRLRRLKEAQRNRCKTKMFCYSFTKKFKDGNCFSGKIFLLLVWYNQMATLVCS